MQALRLLRILLSGYVLFIALLLNSSTGYAFSSSQPILKPGNPPAKSPNSGSTLFFPLMALSDRSQMEQLDIVNPSRGYYRWRGKEIVPNVEPALDAYDRYFWSEIEKSKGEYDFSAIENDIAEAAARGQKFAFRIRAMRDSNSGGIYVPSYLKDCGWYYNNTFIPNWNADCFLNNAENMLNALGQRYDHDPRISWVEIGMYATWGEWSLSDSIYNNAPSGIKPATKDTLIRIVDMHLNAFPTLRKVMMAKANEDAVAHALSASDRIGWRVDCLGKPGYFDFANNPHYDVSWPHMQDRWRTAPVIVEFCSVSSKGMDLTYQTAEDQVSQLHISLVSNGNIEDWDNLNREQKGNLLSIGKKAGYRYKLTGVSLPGTLTSGQAFEISAQWQNIGVAPHYDRVIVKYQLYDPASGGVAWEGESGVDLRYVLPGEPQTQVDAMRLPDGIAAGNYKLTLLILDPTGIRRPLKLDRSGVQPDGSYYLRNVTVQ